MPRKVVGILKEHTIYCLFNKSAICFPVSLYDSISPKQNRKEPSNVL